MTRRSILLLFVIFDSTLSFGQKLGDYYVPISIDSTQGGRLKFLSDSTVELSSIPRHMNPSIKTVYKYTSTDTTIQILPEPLTNQDSQPSGLYVHSLVLKTKIDLTKIDGGFIDYKKSLIYVRHKDFDDNPDMAYIIDGETFIQDMGVTNGYGLIRKSPKKNKALQKKLKGIDIDNCTIEIVKGLNAYKRFGIKRVYGCIVITTK
ncbi:MAG: hypothetical protein H7X99_03355 [Saprospiraceae bacterium]|nr:hypothetical protein [Saprospiraceae bacterium]